MRGSSNILAGGAAVVILSVVFSVIALAGGIVLYFTVFSKQKDGKYTGFMKWLYDFVHFRILTIEAIVKILYIISAISVTLGSFLTFSAGLLGLLLFPLTLIVGNVVVRIGYEFAIMTILLVKNTTEINSKLKNQNDGSAGDDVFAVNIPKKPAAPAAAPAPAPAPAAAQAPVQAAAPAPAPAPAPAAATPAAQAGKKVCPGCGKQLDADSKFCDGCGTKCE